MCKWLKEKWEIVVTAIAIGIAALAVALRTRGQKQNFQNAKESYKAEEKASKLANEELDAGLATISNNKDEALEDLNNEVAEKEELFVEEKEKFAKDASTSSELGKDLADLIGAEFVETNDE